MKLLALLTVATLFACDGATKPTDPVWGKQPCEACKMLVSDPRSAAQLVTAAGDRMYFDDPGCMVERSREEKAPPRGMWVRSASGAWVDARRARYLSGQRTPMDYGFVSAEHGDVDFVGMERAVLARAAARGTR